MMGLMYKLRGGAIMQRKKCISCGYIIHKSSHSDPYLCRDCEDIMVDEESRYAYLDNV